MAVEDRDAIFVRGIEFEANHGYTAEERRATRHGDVEQKSRRRFLAREHRPKIGDHLSLRCQHDVVRRDSPEGVLLNLLGGPRQGPRENAVQHLCGRPTRNRDAGPMASIEEGHPCHRRGILAASVTEVSDDERLVMVLCYAAGFSHGEASEVSGLPLGTIKSHLKRGKEKIRARFDIVEQAGEQPDD